MGRTVQMGMKRVLAEKSKTLEALADDSHQLAVAMAEKAGEQQQSADMAPRNSEEQSEKKEIKTAASILAEEDDGTASQEQGPTESIRTIVPSSRSKAESTKEEQRKLKRKKRLLQSVASESEDAWGCEE